MTNPRFCAETRKNAIFFCANFVQLGKTPHPARPEKIKNIFLKSALQKCVVRKALPESGSFFPKMAKNRPKFPGFSGKFPPEIFSRENFPEISLKFFLKFPRILTKKRTKLAL